MEPTMKLLMMEIAYVNEMLAAAASGCVASRELSRIYLNRLFAPKLKVLGEKCRIGRKYHPLFETIALHGNFDREHIRRCQQHLLGLRDELNIKYS